MSAKPPQTIRRSYAAPSKLSSILGGIFLCACQKIFNFISAFFSTSHASAAKTLPAIYGHPCCEFFGK
jgi:hypothetical protein